jgi:hypothetical protein
MVCWPSPPATRRSICSSALLAAPALLLALAFTPRVALADDRASVEAGRAIGRAVLLLRDPRGCGIALRHDRCVADVDAFLNGRGDADFTSVPKIGPHPASGLRAFVANGDRDGFDFALGWINNRQASADQWTTNPRDAALFDAGILDVFQAAAGEEQVRQMLGAAPAADLAMHAEQIPADALPIDLGPVRALHMTRPNALVVLPFTHDLVRALRTRLPPAPFAGVPSAATPSGEAALGVAVATTAELMEAWPWGLQADAQQYTAALADRLDAVVPSPGRPAVATFRTAVQAGPSFDPRRADEALTSAVAVFMTAGPRDRGLRVGLGSAAAQLAYNAAILRDPAQAGNFLTVLGGTSALDDVLPGWRAARPEAASIKPSDWLAQHAYAMRLVDLIQKANGS